MKRFDVELYNEVWLLRSVIREVESRLKRIKQKELDEKQKELVGKIEIKIKEINDISLRLQQSVGG